MKTEHEVAHFDGKVAFCYPWKLVIAIYIASNLYGVGCVTVG